MQIFGVRIDECDMDGAVRAAMGIKGGYICTPNALMLMEARKNGRLRNALKGSSLNVADGVGVCLAARMLYSRKIHRVAGVELGAGIARECARTGDAIYLFGTSADNAERARASLEERYEGLEIAGVHSGYGDISSVAADIARSGAAFAFVCLGSPRQELWMRDNCARAGQCTLIGLGGSMDVYAGSVSRSPERLSRMGLEWLWRMVREPRRFRRLPALVAFFSVVCTISVKKRLSKRGNNGNIQQN